MNTQFEGRTAWARNLAAPLRSFVNTETSGALALLAASVAALIWANLPWWETYESFWTTDLSIRIGDDGLSLDLRDWVNEGLMTFFFLVVGLEAKREMDLGELRDRRLRRPRDGAHPEIAAGSALVLDVELLPQPLGQLLRE